MRSNRLLAGVAVAVMASAPPFAQPPALPLTLTVECLAPGPDPGHLRFTIRNIDAKPLDLLVGHVFGRGALLPVRVEVTAPDATTPKVFVFSPRVAAAIAGQINPWLVSLLPSQSVSIRAATDDFLSLQAPTGRLDGFAIAGSLVAEFTFDVPERLGPRLARRHFWSGTVRSAPIPVPENCVSGSEVLVAPPAR